MYLYTDQVEREFINEDMKNLAKEFDVMRLAKICAGVSVIIPPSTLSSDFGSLISGISFHFHSFPLINFINFHLV